MTSVYAARLEEIIKHFKTLDPRWDQYQLDGAMPFLKMLAKSSVALVEILAVMTTHQHEGYAVPAIRLGVKKAPKRGSQYMADVRTISYRLSKSDIAEMYGEKANQ